MSPNGPEEALRLVLTYRGGEVKLNDEVRVAMRLMPSDSLERKPQEQLSGFWYELQTKEGETLYRRVMRNPLRAWVDLGDEPGSTRLRHLESERPLDEVTFMLDVPSLPNGDQVVLFSSPLDQPWEAKPAEPRWRIELPRGDR